MIAKESTNQTEFKDLVTSLNKETAEFKKTLEKHGGDVKSLRERQDKTKSETKIVVDTLGNEILKKQIAAIEKLENKIKTIAIKHESNRKYNTPEGLSASLEGGQNEHTYKIAKSILTDPHAEEHRDQFREYLLRGSDDKYRDYLKNLDDSPVSKSESFTKKTLNTIIGQEGGYLVPISFSLAIIKHLFETSYVRRVADVMMITGTEFNFLLRTSIPVATWGDSQLDTQRSAENQQYETIKINVNQMQTEPVLTQSVINDSVINIEQQLRQEISMAFMLAENKAFIDGVGGKEPVGLEFYAKKSVKTVPDITKPLQLQNVEITQANARDKTNKLLDALLNLEASLFSPYKRMGAKFLINRSVKNTIRQIKDSNGQYLYADARAGFGAFQGVPKIRDMFDGAILGYPILECDDLPNIATGNYPIYFGNFMNYKILDRLGMTLIRDNITRKGFVKLYMTKRLGAGLVHGQGIKVLKIT